MKKIRSRVLIGNPLYGKYIYRAWITKNGKKIYPKKARSFRFWVWFD